MNTLDSFTRQYIATALWASRDNSDDSGGSPLDENYSIDDLSPSALAEIVQDCAAFQETYADLLEQAYKHEGYESGSAGHDFWLTRNGHGAGFWDRGLGKLGDELTKAAKTEGSSDLYIGDDGQLYVS